MPRLIDDIVAAQARVVGPDGQGWYTVICPFHDDHRPSLRRNTRGFRCMVCDAKGSLKKLAAKLRIEVTDLGPRPHKTVATYDYLDEQGNLLSQVVRSEPQAFYQRRPDCGGKWVANLKGVRRLLYRLPELLAAPTDD